MRASLSRRTFVNAAALAGLGAAVTSLFGCAPTAKSVTKVRYGEVSSAEDVPYGAVAQQGYFGKHGIEVEKVPYAGFDATYAALRAAEVDGSTSGIATMVKLRTEGVPVLVTFGSDTFVHDMLVPKDSPINSFGDLRGKRIGAYGGAAGTAYNFLVALCVAYYGFHPAKDATIHFGAPPLLAGMLEKGELDACLSLDPLTSTLIAAGKVRSIGYTGEIYEQRTGVVPIVGGINFLQPFAEKNPQAVTSFIAAFVEGVSYLRANPQAWIEIGKKLNLDEAVAAQIRDRSKAGRYPTEWNDRVVEAQIGVLEFIQQHAGREYLETIDRSALTTRYVPKSA
jgi:NitT/TauT family transport system substrate-binding protein